MKRLALIAFSVGVLLAETSATKFKLMITKPTTIAGTTLKPGEYKVEATDSEATLKLDGKTFKVPATLQKDSKMYKETTIEAHDADIRTIHVGGTGTMVVFKSAIPAGGTN